MPSHIVWSGGGDNKYPCQQRQPYKCRLTPAGRLLAPNNKATVNNRKMEPPQTYSITFCEIKTRMLQQLNGKHPHQRLTMARLPASPYGNTSLPDTEWSSVQVPSNYGLICGAYHVRYGKTGYNPSRLTEVMCAYVAPEYRNHLT